MKLSLSLALVSIIMASASSQSQEAPTGFDSKSNGVTDAQHNTYRAVRIVWHISHFKNRFTAGRLAFISNYS